MDCGIHGLVENKFCNSNKIAVLRQRLASFQHLRFTAAEVCKNCEIFLLDTEVFVSNLFLYPKRLAYLCVPFAVVLPNYPSKNSSFLQHSMLSALNRCFRSRSVVPDLCHRISYGTLHWYKLEFIRLAHWPDHWPNVSLLRQNPTCLGPTNLHLVASIPFRIRLRLPSNQTSVASWFNDEW